MIEPKLSTNIRKHGAMPLDKQPANNRTSRPLVPTLNAPNKAGRIPLTPRVAASASSPITPALGRAIHPQKGSPPKTVPQEGISTPVKAFLSANITPRSASRKARVDSAGSTPNHTPTGTPKDLSLNSAIAASFLLKQSATAGDAIEGNGGNGARRRSASVRSEGFSWAGSRSPEAISGESLPPARPSSTIFHADEARSALEGSTMSAGKPERQNKSSCFFYANGDSLDAELASPSSQTVSSPHSRTQPSSRPSSVVSVRKPESLDMHVGLAQGLSHRRLGSKDTPRSPILSTSPKAANPHASISQLDNQQSLSGMSRKAPSPTSSILSRLHGASKDKALDVKGGESTLRRLGMTDRKSSHGRSVSVGSVEGNSFKRRTIGSSSPTSTTSTRASKRVSFPAASSLQTSPEPCDSAPSKGSLPLSPISAKMPTEDSSKSKLQQMNELAANARRERKVLDLEISNSSLLAINRTLEREMRKQNAELRRFRRLSRSGRLSLATSSMGPLSGHVSSTTGLPLGSNVSEISETESEMAASSEADTPDDSSLSADGPAERDARYREMDEKRLQLDLAKHQRLLIDSQKMNQSLKKCLGWTEELIKEGKKALAFKVRVSDIEFGGRVLAPLDDPSEEPNHHPHHPITSSNSTPSRVLDSTRTSLNVDALLPGSDDNHHLSASSPPPSLSPEPTPTGPPHNAIELEHGQGIG